MICRVLLGLLLSLRAFAADDLGPLLEPIRENAKAPALGAVVVVEGKTKGYGVVGLRKFEGTQAVTMHDKWHIGSCTKSMTATLVAKFVEDGLLTWETTVGEVLGDKVKMRPEYQEVTMRMLLANRSGIRGEVPPLLWQQTWEKEWVGDVRTRRLEFVEGMLALPPAAKPGTSYLYSNAGYITAGVMLEIKTGKRWEDLMKQVLFGPLKMTATGFGGAASKGREDQPWGHHDPTKPQRPGRGDDNPTMLGPAGTVHSSLRDLTRYVMMHTLRETGPVLKNASSYDALHAVVEGNKDYALGWGVHERDWAKGIALTHDGSNTMNYCVIQLAPERKFAVIVVSNVGGPVGKRACHDAATALIKKYAR